jgi:hypothetical protein
MCAIEANLANFFILLSKRISANMYFAMTFKMASVVDTTAGSFIVLVRMRNIIIGPDAWHQKC